MSHRLFCLPRSAGCVAPGPSGQDRGTEIPAQCEDPALRAIVGAVVSNAAVCEVVFLL